MTERTGLLLGGDNTNGFEVLMIFLFFDCAEYLQMLRKLQIHSCCYRQVLLLSSLIWLQECEVGKKDKPRNIWRRGMVT